MSEYWMISNRDREGDWLGNIRGPLTFWMAEATDDLSKLSLWKSVTADQFRSALIAAADRFPVLPQHLQEDQKHVALFIHGYNNNWLDAVENYKRIVQNIFSGQNGLGICILFSWPSDGAYLGYLPDRLQANESAPDLSGVLNQFYDWLLQKQNDTMQDPANACKAKVSIIAHSMGAYALEKAMQFTWTRKLQPLLVALINQLILVAADVDNDLFDVRQETSDGSAMANLTYRITAFYTGRDPVLGLAAGLKHFGKRRLGRSGLDKLVTEPDNVWDVDCTTLISTDAANVHSSYFVEPLTIGLIRQVLRGIDRKQLVLEGVAPVTLG